ncbi:unnamed protein product [Mytilus coruscus]|uniref:B box-type domain-containing protein n=1 Tax=Mytilus coruscus TaxID=42192 RepID=A0A6J8CUC6_MYTCO|nr:unnamed protein product [Mytilus coruscus]
MASTSTVVCGICESQHTTTKADFWCPECDEGLCSQCLKHHSASKGTRAHGVISVDNYKQLPSSIANISQYCSQHDRKFQIYCPQHESTCCPLCIQSYHANCIGILSLEKVIETAKTSALMENFDKNIKNIKINAERVVKDRKQNLDEIKKQRQKFQDEIKQIRNKINEHIESLEQQILQDLYAAEQKVKSQIEDLLGKLALNIEKVDLLQTDLSAIKEYASDLQAFLGSKMVETEIQKHEIFLQSLLDDGSLQKIDMNCQIEENLSDVLSTVTSFGSISVESKSPLVVMHTEKHKQAQLRTFHYAPRTDINDIKMTLIRKFDFTCVTGCSISCTGDIFLVDYVKKCLRILKEDGTSKTDLPLSILNPVDVTCINNETVAVTYPNSKQIQIFNITTISVERTINTTGNCYGICYRDGCLLYCDTKIGIQKLNLSDNCSSTLIKDNTLSNCSYVATSEDKVYYTNCSHHTVTCCSLTGENVWEYKDQSVRSSRGISVDKHSNVYIASSGNNSIIVLSSDGKEARTVLRRQVGIENPYGLAFDVKKEKLVVANYSGPKLYGKLITSCYQ